MKSLAPEGIEDREAAIFLHTAMRRKHCPPAEFGNLYRVTLDRKLWPSQAQLAAAFGVSTAHVSRALAMSRLPAEVIAAIGGASKLSFRVARALETLIAVQGTEVIRARAAELAAQRSVDAGRALTFLAKGKFPAIGEPMLTLAVDSSGEFIRIDSPTLDSVIAALPQLEKILQMMVPASPIAGARHRGCRTRKRKRPGLDSSCEG
jgi:hypothetical protein